MKKIVQNKTKYLLLIEIYSWKFIVYELDIWSRDLHMDFILKHCLLGAVKLTKNANLDIFILDMVLDSI